MVVYFSRIFKQIMSAFQKWLDGMIVLKDLTLQSLSNKTSFMHIYSGWISYLRSIKSEYGFSSSSTSDDVGLYNIDNLYNKTIIITGGNSGIGLSVAYSFGMISHKQYYNKNKNKNQCHIIIGSRNKNKSLNEINNIKNKYKYASIEYIPLDLSKYKSITKFIQTIKSLPDNIVNNISILINNAAVALSLKPYGTIFDDNKMDIELSYAVNYFGPFILTELIINNFFKSKSNDYRIVNVSSILHTVTDKFNKNKLMDFNKILSYHKSKEYNHVIVYSYSKLFQIMHSKFMNEYFNKHNINNIYINSCHPGTSNDTGIAQQHFNSNNIFIKFGNYFMKFLIKTNDQCASTVMLLACDKRIKLNNIKGMYFQDCSLFNSSKHSNDIQLINQLQIHSNKMFDQIKYQSKL